MKIRILKDLITDSDTKILSGEICHKDELGLYRWYNGGGFIIPSTMRILLKNGWAEEAEEQIDMEEIRNSIKATMNVYHTAIGTSWTVSASQEELYWFICYRIVKAVIEKLNEEGKDESYFILSSEQGNRVGWEIDYKICSKSIFPGCTSQQICRKVIKLCEPELKVLFNIQ